jgi:hypothetical protein
VKNAISVLLVEFVDEGLFWRKAELGRMDGNLVLLYRERRMWVRWAL